MNALGINDVDYSILSKLAEAIDDENSDLLYFEASTLDGIVRMKLLDVTDEEDFDGRTFILCVDVSDDNKTYLDEEGRAHLKILEFRDGVNLAEVDDEDLLADLAEYFEASLIDETGIEDDFDVSDGLAASAVINPDVNSEEPATPSWGTNQSPISDTGGIGDFDADFNLDGIEIAGIDAGSIDSLGSKGLISDPDSGVGSISNGQVNVISPSGIDSISDSLDQFLNDTSHLVADYQDNVSSNQLQQEDTDGDFDDEYI